MNDIQRAISRIENEIQIMERYNIDQGRVDVYKTAISAMQELQRYRQIGILEECREAREKQKAQKVSNIKGDKLKFGTCPACTKRISDVEGGNYCQNCGQKLDWSEEENDGEINKENQIRI